MQIICDNCLAAFFSINGRSVLTNYQYLMVNHKLFLVKPMVACQSITKTGDEPVGILKVLGWMLGTINDSIHWAAVAMATPCVCLNNHQ